MTDYFERRAGRYLEDSRSGLWRRFREKEFAAIMGLLDPHPEEFLLELGCGAGFYSVPLSEKYGMRVTGVDVSGAMLQVLNRRCPSIETHLAAIERFQTSRRFDKVLAAGVFEFMDDLAPAAKLIAHAMKVGGSLTALVPAPGWAGVLYKWAHQVQGCPAVIRKREDFEDLFHSYGLELVDARSCTILSFAMNFRKAREIF